MKLLRNEPHMNGKLAWALADVIAWGRRGTVEYDPWPFEVTSPLPPWLYGTVGVSSVRVETSGIRLRQLRNFWVDPSRPYTQPSIA